MNPSITPPGLLIFTVNLLVTLEIESNFAEMLAEISKSADISEITFAAIHLSNAAAAYLQFSAFCAQESAALASSKRFLILSR